MIGLFPAFAGPPSPGARALCLTPRSNTPLRPGPRVLRTRDPLSRARWGSVACDVQWESVTATFDDARSLACRD